MGKSPIQSEKGTNQSDWGEKIQVPNRFCFIHERTYGSENLSSKRDDQEDMANGENSL